MTAIRDSKKQQAATPPRRLFFGLWPPPDVVPDIMRCVRMAHQACGGRMMRADTLHMTLAFLGPANQERTHELVRAARTWTVNTGRITLRRTGRFHRPGVVWAGPESGQPEWLYGVYDRLWDRLAGLGWTRPTSSFTPHVSLLRNAGEGDCVPCPPISWVSGPAVLVASKPQAGGSCYQVLTTLAAAP